MKALTILGNGEGEGGRCHFLYAHVVLALEAKSVCGLEIFWKDTMNVLKVLNAAVDSDSISNIFVCNHFSD